MNGELVGCWTLGPDQHRFSYDASWLASPNARPVSLSMPLRPGAEPYRTEVVQPFFDNLLPDSDEIRRRIMVRFGASSTSAFDLLEQVGRDCVGAVQLLRPDGPRPEVHVLRGRRLTGAAIGKLLADVRGPAMGAQNKEEFRFSLAGAQEKIALLRHGNEWLMPEGTTPSTHIFKLPMLAAGGLELDLSTSVENEWLCSEILRQYGVPCARSQIRTFAGQRVLVVERFDRRLAVDGSWIMRLPQEDFCQVTGTPPGRKYERDGGPGIVAISNLLYGSSNAIEDRVDFFRTQFLFWLLCAIDGHAKNFSVSLEAGGSYRLTPRYDVLSAYPIHGKKPHQLSPYKTNMAMAVSGQNRHYKWREIRTEHWLQTGHRCGLGRWARDLIEEILEKTQLVIKRTQKKLPAGFPVGVSDTIFEGLLNAATASKKQLK